MGVVAIAAGQGQDDRRAETLRANPITRRPTRGQGGQPEDKADRNSRASRGDTAAELGKNLQNSVQVRHSRAKTIDEFIEDEFTVEQMIRVVDDFLGHGLKELGLDAAERLGCFPARFRKSWICLFPLLQLRHPLLLRIGCVFDQFLQQFILPCLANHHFSKEGDDDRVVIMAATRGRGFCGDINTKNWRNMDRFLGHRQTHPCQAEQ